MCCKINKRLSDIEYEVLRLQEKVFNSTQVYESDQTKYINVEVDNEPTSSVKKELEEALMESPKFS